MIAGDYMKYSFFAASSSEEDSEIKKAVFDTDISGLSFTCVDRRLKGVQFMAAYHKKRKLYAVTGSEKEDVCILSTYDYQGEVIKVGEQRCHIKSASYLYADDEDSVIYISDYLGSKVAAMPMDKKGIPAGRLCEYLLEGCGPVCDRQDRAHPHSIIKYRDGVILVPDLGSDCIWQLQTDDLMNFKLKAENRVSPGSGPRHICCHPAENRVYVISELNSRVSVYQYISSEEPLHMVQEIFTLPENYEGLLCGSDIRLNREGDRLYAGNRGYNSITEFRIDTRNGMLSVVRRIRCGGWPRLFHITPDGNYIIALIEEYSDSEGAIEVYELKQGSCILRRKMSNAYAMTNIEIEEKEVL